MRNTIVSPSDVIPAMILNGQASTAPLNLGGLRLFGIVMPALWTPACLTFRTSFDNGASWFDLYDANGNELSVITGVSRFIAIDPVNFAAIHMIRLRSGTSGASVNQSQDAVLQLVLRAV